MRRAELGGAPVDLDRDQGWYRFEGDVHTHGWPDVGVFKATRTEVLYDPAPGAAEGIVQHVLLGPVLASVLLLRDLFPLHASANHVGSFAIAMVGQSGQGKSSLAVALKLRGHPIHSDDLLAIPLEGSPPEVHFGIGRLKLHRDVLESAALDAEAYPRIYDGVDKRGWAVLGEGESEPAPLPLRAIYRLMDADAYSIERVDPKRAVFELLMNSFRPEVSQHALGGKRLFEMSGSVARRVPVFQFRRPRDLGRLAEAAELLATHALSL